MKIFLLGLVRFACSVFLAFILGCLVLLTLDWFSVDRDLGSGISLLTILTGTIVFINYLPLLHNNPGNLIDKKIVHFFKPTPKELTNPKRIPFSEIYCSAVISLACYFSLHPHCSIFTMCLITIFFASVTFWTCIDARIRMSRRLHSLKFFDQEKKIDGLQSIKK